MRVQGKVALITGAAGPMGGAIAARYASEGATVVITDISQKRLDACVAELEALPGRVGKILAHRANVTVEAEAVELARAALEKFGRVDILVNVVGGIASKAFHTPFLEIDEEQWQGTFAFNLDGTRFLIRELAPGMLSRGYGRIVNISSIDYAGAFGHADYAASKAAVVALSRTLAMEFAPAVTVNCITPGLINTRAMLSISPDDIEELRQANLMKRLGEPYEIASAALFLGSDDASFMTGEIMSVSGGVWRNL